MRHADMTMGLSQRGRLGFNRRAPLRSGDMPGAGVDFGGLPLIMKTVWRWLERRRQRQALSLLDDRMLQDIGLDRLDVTQEIEKPFWQG